MGFFTRLRGKKIFLVGIKGTGMASLACLLSQFGAHVQGSDVPEQFSTDAVLVAARIAWTETFSAEALPVDTDMVIHSAAYDTTVCPQLVRAVDLGLPVYSYPAFLAAISGAVRTFAVAGTHGKTTTTGCLDWILRNTGLPFFSIYGSHIQGNAIGRKPNGDEIAILESCEYRDHFLSYQLQGVLVTTIEHDHPDWFADVQQTLDSFKHLVMDLPQDAFVVCGIDSEYSRNLAKWIQSTRPDVSLTTFGTHPSSMFRVSDHEDGPQESSYSLAPLPGYFHSRLASVPLCLDIVGAAIFATSLVLREAGIPIDLETLVSDPVLPAMLGEAATFPGCAGRLETILEDAGVVYVDDYAHHPTEISTSLASLRATYPEQRLVTIFFPHTVSRTRAFFDGFAAALRQSDVLIIRPVYASARHDGSAGDGSAIAGELAAAAGGHFIAHEETLVSDVAMLLHPGDVCITMGAGNNSGLAKRIADVRRSSRC
jgi:UDP-N-acetylmuramate--alanine ligase